MPKNISTNFQEQQVPGELSDVPQWVIWKLELRDNKWTKVLYCPADPSSKAKTNDLSTWGSFQEAVKAATESNEVFGIGFVFTGERLSNFFDIVLPVTAGPPYLPKGHICQVRC